MRKFILHPSAFILLALAFACNAGTVTLITDLEADTAKAVTGPQSNQVAAAAAHVPRTDNPHGVTAAQLGALTAETDAAALAVLATQRVERIELGGRIIDATNGVWQIVPATSTNWYFTETYNNITTALPQLSYPLPADYYVEMQRGGSTYFTISCMTDLPTYDHYTGVEVYLSPGGALGTSWVTTDPFHGFDGWFSDPDLIVRNATLFWSVEPTGGLATNHVGTLALEGAAAAGLGTNDVIAITEDLYVQAAATNAPVWIGTTNLAAAAGVTLTNAWESPHYLYGTGSLAVAFHGLRSPQPVYLVVRGPAALTFPSSYIVGGGSYQTNHANHFIAWSYGTNTFVSPITTTED